MALFWRRLPEVSRRRFQGRVFLRFGTRLKMFFLTFFVCFGAYVMAFVTGANWGVEYGHRCLAVCKMLSDRMMELLSGVDEPIVRKIGSGVARIGTNDMSAVIIVSFLVAVGVVIMASALSVLVAFARMFGGRDGSQAEIYDEESGIEGAADATRERRRRKAWRPNVSHNPYSVTLAHGD